jgi:hypothetical protein
MFERRRASFFETSREKAQAEDEGDEDRYEGFSFGLVAGQLGEGEPIKGLSPDEDILGEDYNEG